MGADEEESCLCPVSYTGKLCEVRIGYCEPNPCQNGGTCVFLLGGYVCSCTPSASGRDCEIGASSNTSIRGLHLIVVYAICMFSSHSYRHPFLRW